MLVQIGQFSKEETPHLVFPDYDQVFTPDLINYVQRTLIPLLTIDLAAINLGQGKLHCLYFESGHEWISYEMDSAGKIFKIKSGDSELEEIEDPCTPEDLEEFKNNKGGFLKFKELNIEFEEPDPALKPDWDWQTRTLKQVEDNFNDYYLEFLGLRLGGYPYYYQGGYKSGKKDFIGQIRGTFFKLSDICFYHFKKADQAKRVDILAQST